MSIVTKRILYTTVGLLALAAILLLTRLACAVATSRTTFDRIVWLGADPTDRDSPRFSMIDDLGRTILLPGTDKSIVSRELGEPTQVLSPLIFGHSRLPSNIAYVWNYEIGAWSGWRIDIDYLAVGFSADGKTVKHWIWQS